MRKFSWGLAVGVFFGFILLSACQIREPRSQSTKITIALPVQQSGYAKEMMNAVKLAEKEAQGYAGDHPVEFLYLDTSAVEEATSFTEAEIKVVQQVIEDPAVVAYIGCTTSARAKAVIPILNQAGIVTLSPSATWPGLTKPGYAPGAPGIFYPSGARTFFRVAVTDDTQGGAAARWAVQLGARQVYVVDDAGLYGQGVAGIFEVTARDEGMEVIAHEHFNGTLLSADELNSLAARVVSAHPDMVFLGSSLSYGGGTMLTALRQRDPEIKVIVPDGMVKDQLLQELPLEVTDGVYGTNIVLPAEQLFSPKAVQFVASYQDAYGRIPRAFVVNAYEEAQVILKAIAQTSSPVTRAGVLEAMKNLGEYSGVLGHWSFTDTGDIDSGLCSGWQVVDGTWLFVKVLR